MKEGGRDYSHNNNNDNDVKYYARMKPIGAARRPN